MPYPGYPMGSADDLESLADECRTLGAAMPDVCRRCPRRRGRQRGRQSAADQFGGIDILFNNAGICGYGLAHELTEDAWDSMIDINLKGPWIVARRVIPIMIERRRGVIINNASVAGLPRHGPALPLRRVEVGARRPDRSWAIELAPYNIRVVALCPTGVNTPMNDGLALLEGKTPREIAERSAGNLLPMPWIEPEDVAGAVVFLASSKSPGHHRLGIHARRRFARPVMDVPRS